MHSWCVTTSFGADSVTAWATVAVAAFTAGLVVAATWAGRIALVQLHSFNDNERIKNTLGVLARLNESIQTLRSGKVLSPITALGLLASLSPGEVEDFRASVAAVQQNGVKSMSDQQYNEINDAVPPILNFISPLPKMIERNLVDRDLLLSELELLIPHAREVLENLGLAPEALRPLDDMNKLLVAR